MRINFFEATKQTACIFSKGDKNNPQGLRVHKHIFVGNSRLVTAMTHTDNNGDNAEQREKRYYYHSDHLGSAQFVTDWRGRQYEHIEYTPYGELWIEEVAAGLDKLPFRFTGKEMDEETGLYYYGARYLDPKYSRWLSGDPALSDYIPKAPVDDKAKKHNEKLPGMGGVFNVVNLHLYHYAGNNPVKYTDPDGKNIFDDIGSAVKNAWEKTVDVANTAKDTVVNTISASWNAITYFHFEGRDEKNIISESFNDIEKSSRQTDGNWIELPEEMAMYHQNGIGSPERKFICKDGREAVFSKDDSPNGSYQLVTDPRYKGTYNYCNPAPLPTLPNGITDFKGIGNCISASLQFAVKGAGHFFADMLPYYVTGCKNERNQ